MSDKHNKPMIVRGQDQYLAELIADALKSRALVRDMREALGMVAANGDNAEVWAEVRTVMARADTFLEKP